MSLKFIYSNAFKIKKIFIGITNTSLGNQNFNDFCSTFKSFVFCFYFEKEELKVFVNNEHYFIGNLKYDSLDEIFKEGNHITFRHKSNIKEQHYVDLFSNNNSLYIVFDEIEFSYNTNTKVVKNNIFNDYDTSLITIQELIQKIENIKSYNANEILYEDKLDDGLNKVLENIKTCIDYNAEAEDILVQNLNEDDESRITYISYKPTESCNNSRCVYYEFKCKMINNKDILNQVRVLSISDVNLSIDPITAKVIDNIEIFDDYFKIILSLEEEDVDKIPSNGLLLYVAASFQNEIRADAISKLLNNYDSPLNNLYSNKSGKIDISSQKSISNSTLDINQIIKSHKYPPNEFQDIAIRKGANLDNSGLLVLGPPGTGKTTVIVDWIRYYVSRGKKVLVSSMSNMAVDNALKGCLELGDISLVRLGDENKIKDENIKNYTLDKVRANFQNDIQNKVDDNISKNEINLKKYQEYKEKYSKFIKLYNQLYEEFDSKYNFNNYQRVIQLINDINNSIFKNKSNINRLENQLSKRNILTKILFYISDKNKQKNIEYLRFANDELTNILKKTLIKIKSYNNYFYKLIDDFIYEIKNYKWNFFTFDEESKNVVSDISNLINYYIKYKMPVLRLLNIFDNLNKKIKNLLIKIDKKYQIFMRLQVKFKEYNDFLINHINDFDNDLIDNVEVVGATCIGIQSNKAFKYTDFDVVIIDEAGQILAYDVLVPLSKAKENFIMVGDHKQIPPVASCALDQHDELDSIRDKYKEYLSKSYFELLYNDLANHYKKKYVDEIHFKHIVDLNTQYRMPSSISDILSANFYNNNYYAFEKKKTVEPKFNFLSNFLLIDTGHDSNESKIDSGYINNSEIDIIVEIVKTIKKKEPNFFNEQKNIGIIAPYKSQVKELINRLNAVLDNQASRFVNTLDSFQGQERDVIIFSFVRSNKSSERKGDNMIGFLKETRRINVALSRCKEQLICVGDFKFLSNLKEVYKDEEIKMFNQFLYSMVDTAKKNAMGDKSRFKAYYINIKEGEKYEKPNFNDAKL